jgi:hypothetical protein
MDCMTDRTMDGYYHGIFAPAWGDDLTLIGVLEAQADGENWDSERNRALMLRAADRISGLLAQVQNRDAVAAAFDGEDARWQKLYAESAVREGEMFRRLESIRAVILAARIATFSKLPNTSLALADALEQIAEAE